MGDFRDQVLRDYELGQFDGAGAAPAVAPGVDSARLSPFRDEVLRNYEEELNQEFAPPMQMSTPKEDRLDAIKWGPTEQLANALMLGHGEPVAALENMLYGNAPTYGEARERVGAAKQRYRTEKPAQALAIDIGGSILPTVAALALGKQFGVAPVMARYGPLLQRAGLGGLARWAGMGAEGAAAGALTSGLTPDSTAQDVGYGTAAGLIAGPFGAALASPLKSHIVAPVANMAKRFIGLGVPIKTGQIPGAPLSTKLFSSTTDKQLSKFNRAVSRTIGADTDNISNTTLFGNPGERAGGAAGRIGSAMEKLTGRYAISQGDDEFPRTLARIRQAAESELGGDDLKRVAKHLDELDVAWNKGAITGEQYQRLTNFNSPIYRDLAGNNPDRSFFAGEIKGALDDAWERALPSDSAGEWRTLKQQYKNVMTLKNAIDETTESLKPNLLYNSVRRKFRGSTANAGDLGVLAEGGKNFLVPHMGDKGIAASILKRHPFAAGGVAGAMGVGGAHSAESVAMLAAQNPIAAAGLGTLGAGYLGGGLAMSSPKYASFLARTGGRGLNAMPNLLYPPLTITKPGAEYIMPASQQ